MRILITILFVLFSFVGSGQEFKKGQVLTVTNTLWDCGGYNPQKAKVVLKHGRLLIKFDFYSDKSILYLPIKEALRFWEMDGTKIVGIKK